MSQKRFRFFIVALFLSITIQAAMLYLSGHSAVTEGPPSELAKTSRAIWNGETISQNEYYQLQEHLERTSANDGRSYWQDVFVLGKNQTLLPKHCYVFSLLAAPFYGVFGEFGFWIFNLACALALLLGVYWTSFRLFGPEPARLSTVLATIGTQYFVHTYSFSYDLLAATLVLVGLAVIEKSTLWGSFLICSSILVRVSCLTLAPALLLAHFIQQSKRSRCNLVLGSFAALVLNCIFSYAMWGELFSTPYQHLTYFDAGVMKIDSTSHFISFKTLIESWPRKLFGTDVGLLLYNPALLIIPYALYRIISSNSLTKLTKIQCLLYCTSALLYFALTFSYSMWMVSSPGNRFMLPGIFILMVLVGGCCKLKSIRIHHEGHEEEKKTF